MKSIPTVADFNLNVPVKSKGLRPTKNKVEKTREALGKYHIAFATRHKVLEQLEHLAEISKQAMAYCHSKSIQNAKTAYMWQLHLDCDTLTQEIFQHAQRAQANFTAGHHAAQLPANVRHAQQRISTGVGLLPQYRLEHYTAKHAPSQRIHGGNFLASKDMGHPDFAQMDPIVLYSLIKEFKHVNHRDKHLDYFDDPARTRIKLSKGPNNTVLQQNAPLDTTGQVELKRFNANGVLTNAHSQTFYTQNSGGADGFAVYACSIDGDFYVHLDLADHAGTYQHSSILAGAQVTCAGTIYCVKGRVCILSNNSGHYQPTAGDLHDAMVAMRDDLGVDPKTVLIQCKDTRGDLYICSGETLLALGVGQGIESLPPNLCLAKDTNSLNAIKMLSMNTITEWAVAEKQDQSNTIQKIRAVANVWTYRPPGYVAQ